MKTFFRLIWDLLLGLLALIFFVLSAVFGHLGFTWAAFFLTVIAFICGWFALAPLFKEKP